MRDVKPMGEYAIRLKGAIIIVQQVDGSPVLLNLDHLSAIEKGRSEHEEKWYVYVDGDVCATVDDTNLRYILNRLEKMSVW